MINSVVIVGRVGQDPEMKYFESGKVKTSFSTAVNRWDAASKAEVTDWFNVELWDRQAEIAGEYVKKGRLVAVDGRLSANKWKSPDGAEKERFVITGGSIKLLSSPKSE